MKIAVFHNLPGGGAKRSLSEWLRILKKDYEIDLYGFKDLTSNFCNLEENISVLHSIPKNPKSSKGITGRLLSIIKVEYYCRIIANKINRINYDFVFVLQCEITNSPPLLRMLKHKTAYYCQEPLTRMLEPHYNYHSHNNSIKLIRSALTKLFVWYDRFNANYASIIFCNSYYSKENIYRAYGRYPKLSYLGINATLFKENPIETKDKSLCLTVGHLNAAKGHDFLINSLALINENIRPKLEIVYNLENVNYKNYLIKLAAEKKVELIFSKSLCDAELIAKYNKAYIVLCAPRLEPFGLSPIESMACGTPVIGVSEGGIRESILDQKTGLLVERIEAQMADRIQMLLINDLLYSELRKNARKNVINKWSWENSTQTILNEIRHN